MLLSGGIGDAVGAGGVTVIGLAERLVVRVELAQI